MSCIENILKFTFLCKHFNVGTTKIRIHKQFIMTELLNNVNEMKYLFVF